VPAVRSERVEDGVELVTLDRPRANAVDVATSHALHDAFAAAERDPAVRVTVVTGAGTAFFSAGWDLKAAAAGEAVDADHGPGGFAGLTEMWHRRTPVVAAVNGLALGGGLELALAADLVVAAEHAQLGLPEVTLGLVADSGGLLRLRRALPQAIASEMLLTGRRMGADEAARWGLVNRVTSSADLLDGALELARSVVRAAPLAVAAVLEVEQETSGLDVRAGFERMRSGSLPAYDGLLGSEDALEGPRAFAEGRPPRWVGHQTVQQNREGTT
jgi:crotonobetainyl-CoA hydratase